MKEEKEKKKSVKDCIHCGMCKQNCPTYKVLKDEIYGPRARALMIKNKSVDETFYICNLCGACEQNCPLGLKLNLREQRIKLKRTKKNEKMINNIRKYGNPFGKDLESDEIPDELYCC